MEGLDRKFYSKTLFQKVVEKSFNYNTSVQMATTANVSDVSSSSSDNDADNVPLRRRMSDRKRRLSDKTEEALKQQDEAKVGKVRNCLQ